MNCSYKFFSSPQNYVIFYSILYSVIMPESGGGIHVGKKSRDLFLPVLLLFHFFLYSAVSKARRRELQFSSRFCLSRWSVASRIYLFSRIWHKMNRLSDKNPVVTATPKSSRKERRGGGRHKVCRQKMFDNATFHESEFPYLFKIYEIYEIFLL